MKTTKTTRTTTKHNSFLRITMLEDWTVPGTNHLLEKGWVRGMDPRFLKPEGCTYFDEGTIPSSAYRLELVHTTTTRTTTVELQESESSEPYTL